MERDATIEAQQQEIMEAHQQITHISRILNLRNKKIFGSASEKHAGVGEAEDLAFEEVKSEEVSPAGETRSQSGEVAGERPGSIKGERVTAVKKGYRKGHPGRNPLPAHIRREVEHFYPEGYDNSWNREMPPEITERLTLKIDFYVKVDVRHKFARGSAIVVAPCAVEDPFYKYKATTELVCNMMYLRFGLHVPYYRFMQLLPGCGLSYATLIGWAGRTFEILAPLEPVLGTEILKDTRLLSMDDTPNNHHETPPSKARLRAELSARQDRYLKMAVGNSDQADVALGEDDAEMEAEITAGVARKKVVLKGQMWTLLNPTTRMVKFQYSASRATINAIEMLGDYKGLLMADAYIAYRQLARLSPEAIILLSCWAHARRKILESQHPKYQDPVVKEVLRRIGLLYEIERKIRGQSPNRKKRLRKRSAKILRSLKRYLEQVIDRYTPKDAVRIAIQYILNHWEALSEYVKHKHGIIDNNANERALKPLTVARKNILFLGSVDHAPGAALLYSLIECCKLQKIDPQEWLLDVMKRIEHYPKDQLVDLLPHRWKINHQSS
jgi:transposase